jgi:threonine/homoserine/homoserine lactone efflux protein
MTFETWFAFALAAAAMLAIPGPTTLPVIGQSLNRAGGSVLVGAGVATAAMRRAA